jgi:hypothetical protein
MCECGLNPVLDPADALVRSLMPPGSLRASTFELLAEFVSLLRNSGYEIVSKENTNIWSETNPESRPEGTND